MILISPPHRHKPALPDAEHLDARAVLEHVLDEYHPWVALACSFQLEESVLLDMVFSVRDDARVFTLDTDLLFPETYALWREVEERYSTTIEAFRGPSLGEQEARRGATLWEREPDACCALRKVEPLGRALSGLECWITGVRREQSPTRAGARKLEWDARHGLVKVNPLADWTSAQVEAYVREHDLPYNALHDRGYASIGCVHCTRPGTGREGRWAGREKTECGLHPGGVAGGAP